MFIIFADKFVELFAIEFLFSVCEDIADVGLEEEVVRVEGLF